jgi:hypothetical protein
MLVVQMNDFDFFDSHLCTISFDLQTLIANFMFYCAVQMLVPSRWSMEKSLSAGRRHADGENY